MSKEELKKYIDDNIYENEDGEITGEGLNAVLKAIVDDGGTEVEANPEGGGKPSILRRIKIDDEIYEAPIGPQGDPGDNAYIHIKYAASVPSSDSDMHDTPQSGDKYIGVYSGDSSTAPNSYTSYTWSKYVGEDGANGQSGDPGAPGDNAYVHIKYAASVPSSDSDMHATPQSGDKFIGVYSGDSSTAPTSYTSYTWSKYVGEDGATGPQGPQGEPGTEVEANPVGEPTETLEKLKIGNTIYNVPQGQQSEKCITLEEYWNSLEFPVDANGYELPCSVGVLNAMKRAKQMSDIKYTAKSAYPNNSGATGGTAGEHTGLPYSSVKELFTYIGFNVSLKTFMTAVNNPYSMFYTEDIAGSPRSNSDYGFTYGGTNCGTYFGTVCSSFVCYAYGAQMPYATNAFSTLFKNNGSLIELKEQSAQGVHLMDMVLWTGHAGIVTSVKRDSYGNVTDVEVSDSATPNIRKRNLTATQFNNILADGGGTLGQGVLYRYTKLYNNVAYNQSEFVAVMGESTQQYSYNNSICTYKGDYATFRRGFPVWLNYNKQELGTQLHFDDSNVFAYTGPVYGMIDANLKLMKGSSKWYFVSITPGKKYTVVNNGSGFQSAVLRSMPSSFDFGQNPYLDAPMSTYDYSGSGGKDFTKRFVIPNGATTQTITTFVAPPDAAVYCGVFHGDMAIYESGAVEYDSVEIYKDSTLIDTLSLNSDSSVHKIKITDEQGELDGEGLYKARLKDTANSLYSSFCYFEIIETGFTVSSISNGVVRVTLPVTQNVPQYISVQRTAGGGGAFLGITSDNIADGYIDFDPDQVWHDTYGSSLNQGEGYIRIVVKGQYGSDASEALAIPSI